MGIPINQALISGAVPYQAIYNAIPVKVCRPDPFGPKSIPLQFTFADTTCWNIDLSVGILSVNQISAVYIDAINCTQDVVVYFPDTGYQIKVLAGKALLCPVFTGQSRPQFYVSLINGVVSSSDIVNLILLNFFIPEFATA